MLNRGKREHELLNTLEAVSYTHLDVYKRQDQYCALNNQMSLSKLVNLKFTVYSLVIIKLKRMT